MKNRVKVVLLVLTGLLGLGTLPGPLGHDGALAVERSMDASSPSAMRDVIAFATLDEARTLSAQGKTAEAAVLYDQAVTVAPDLPAVHFSRAAFTREASTTAFLRGLVDGVMAIPQNTAWTVTLLGGLAFILLWGFWGAFAAYLFSLGTLKARLLQHDAGEGNKKRSYAAALALGGIPFGLIPALLVASVVMLPYLSKRERFPLYAMGLWAILSFWVVGWGGAFLAFPTSPEAKGIVAVNEGRDNRYGVSVMTEDREWTRGFSRGLALSRAGYLQEAITVYEGVRAANDRQRAQLENNIANCKFRAGDIPGAIELYSRHIDSGLVSILYNLSQAYREVLKFDEGDRLFSAAQRMDADAVGRFREASFVVVDENLGRLERLGVVASLWKRHPEIIENLFRPFILWLPSLGMPVIGLLYLVILVVLGRGQSSRRAAYRCRKCHEIVCPVCDSRGGDGMCGPCGKPVEVGGADDPSARVARMISVRKRNDRQRTLLRMLCIVPGLSDLAAGRPGRAVGYLGALVFGMLLVIVPLPVAVFNGMEPMTGLRVIAFCVVVLLYLANFSSVSRRLEKGWL